MESLVNELINMLETYDCKLFETTDNVVKYLENIYNNYVNDLTLRSVANLNNAISEKTVKKIM